MSIIGSAWGQETVTTTFTLDVSEMEKNDVGDILTNGYSNEYISMSFSECQKYDYSIKINGWSDKVPLQFLTVTPNGNNVTITKVVLKGALSDGNDQGKTIKVGDITLTAGKDEDNYSRTYEPTEGVSEPVVFVKEGGTSYMQSIVVTYTYTTDYNTNANASVLQIGSAPATATNANIFTYKGCVITENGQLIDSGSNESYVTLKVTPSVSGTYSFTSEIATAYADRYVTFSCEDADGNAVTVENATKNITSNSWTEGDNYTWTAVLESGKTYEIKLLTGYTNQNGNTYTVNIYDMTIVRTPDKTGLIQIPVDMLNISANTTQAMVSTVSIVALT